MMKQHIASFLTLLLLGTNLLAQTRTAEQEIPTVHVSVVQISDQVLPPMYVLDPESPDEPRFLQLPVSKFARGEGLKIPIGEDARIYTGKFNNEGKPEMKPLFTFKPKPNQERALLLVYLNLDGTPGHLIVDDSAEVHPAGTLRVLNVSPETITFVAGDQRYEVPSGAARTVEPKLDDQRRFPFVYRGLNAKGEVFTSPIKELAFRKEDARILILYTALPQEIPTGARDADGEEITETIYAPIDFRLYDKI